MFSKEDYKQAYHRISEYVSPSPIRYSDWLSEQLDAEVFLKFESFQPGRSFKIRGATNALLSQSTLPEQVITASGGNHGLGVAIASKRVGVPCQVILPTSTSSYRVKLLEDQGAQVELHGESWDDANDYALGLAKDEENLYIHPFADKEVMLGQGTIVMELEEQLGDYNAFAASVGGGGLLTGNAMAIEALEKKDITKIIAVETEGADSLAQSLANNKLVELPAITSIAKTLGARQTTQFILDNLTRLVDEMLVVDDRAAVKAMVDFLDHEKLLVEPAMSCIIAALQQNKEVVSNHRLVVVVCGSNITLTEFENWREEFDV